ncbi:MAG: glycosyltransferase [Buchananella hordeovulneris]|nr:glycosyltransferase [Buchananella hordeovulneris]
MEPDTIKVVLYSHDSQGLGHVRRNLAIAHHLAAHLPALTGKAVAGLLISGLAPTHRFPLPAGFDWVTIPGVSKGKNGYQARHLATKTGSLIHLRSQLLEASLLGFAPDLLIVDRHIYGVWNELRRPLEKLRAAHPHSRVVLGLREVLDTPAVAAGEWEALGDPLLMRGLVDQVWVYGDARVHNMIATGEAPASLADRIRFTGYLAKGRRVTDAASTDPDVPYILTTAGGGQDGTALLVAAARAEVPAGYRHLVVTGPQISDADFEQVAAGAEERTEVIRSLPGLGRHISYASAVIAMGGYNTICEILATDTPALVVPREAPRREQLIRAQALASVGAVDYLRTPEVSTEALSTWLATAVGRTVTRDHLDRAGLEQIPGLALRLLHAPNGGQQGEQLYDVAPAASTPPATAIAAAASPPAGRRTAEPRFEAPGLAPSRFEGPHFDAAPRFDGPRFDGPRFNGTGAGTSIHFYSPARPEPARAALVANPTRTNLGGAR